MKIAECNHLRIRDGNNYGMNVEQTIKYYEDLYQLDFRSLPQWEKLVQRMHLAITDCKRKIQDSKRRKATIIDKLCIESCRPSPFELTDELVRTAKKWQKMEANLKVKKKSMISLTESAQISTNDDTVYGEILGEGSLGHPNTEVGSSAEPVGGKEEFVTVAESHLPVYVCSNPHNRLSMLRSDDSSLSFSDSAPTKMYLKRDKKPDEWLVLPKSTNIISVPSKITMKNQSIKEQTVSFSLINCSSEYPYLNLRYKGVTDNTPFRKAKIIPATPVKLYPGLPVNFKFVFKLQPNSEDFAIHLFFKVGQKVLAEAPIEGFSVLVDGIFSKKPRDIHITEEINIPSTFFWHINANSGFPSSAITIKVPDDYSYNLHVTKLNKNVIQESEHDSFSIEPMTPSTTTMAQKEQDQQVIAQSKTFVSSTQRLEESESTLLFSSIEILINDAIDRALDVFVFEKTFLALKPFSRYSIKVYQTKAEHIGFHQSLYELKFTNPVTEEIAFQKTIKVFGEVLGNPVQIQPGLLDMTVSPIIHGRCEDHFTIFNSHKVFPVTIKIKLSAKMKQLIGINPMKTSIPAHSRVKFLVGLCSKDLAKNEREDFVHLTIKIVVIGDKFVYHNMPPIYYEILAPCSSEFIKLYKKQF